MSGQRLPSVERETLHFSIGKGVPRLTISGETIVGQRLSDDEVDELLTFYEAEGIPDLVEQFSRELVPISRNPLDRVHHGEQVAAEVAARTGLRLSDYRQLDDAGKLYWLKKATGWLFDNEITGKQEPDQVRKTPGKKAKGPRKIDIAITIIVRDPSLTDSDVAKKVPCDKSLLSRSEEYQRNAEMARRAKARLPQSGNYNARTGTLEAIDDRETEVDEES